MHRSPDSHKGENGKVAVIGGSEQMHGAPLFSALAAEASGVDLLYVALPRCHWEVAKAQSLNFQVRPFAGDEIAQRDIDALLQMLATVDAAVIGPGLQRTDSAQRVIRELIESAPCPLVLDASALHPWTLQAMKGKEAVVTPHLGELERMHIDPERVLEVARESGCMIHLKGRIDRIACIDGALHDVEGGDAGLTVGGTGDALSGLIAGLRAQSVPASEACILASKAIKGAGATLHATKGFSYTTRDVIGEIPRQLAMLQE